MDRDSLAETLLADRDRFRDRVRSLSDWREWVRTDALDGSPDRIDTVETVRDSDSLAARERELVWRLWLLDDCPLGLTLSGPAFRDNPLHYANRTFRELTGYSMERLHGENPRLLQGPETPTGPVADLREAIANWNRVTVELRNYRQDGTEFCNRVTLVPVAGADGTIHDWLGMQRLVEQS